MNPNYVSAASVAKKFDISMSTMRRRIMQGRIPEARKMKSTSGEIWQIPRTLANKLTLKDLSPKRYQEQQGDIREELQPQATALKTEIVVENLEKRVAILEQLALKIAVKLES